MTTEIKSRGSAADLFADIGPADESKELNPADSLFEDIGVANASTSFAGDMGRLFGVGLNRTMGALGGAVEMAGEATGLDVIDRAGEWIQEKTDTRAGELMNQLSPEQQQAMQKKYTEKADGTKGFGEAWTDPRTTMGHVVTSAPGMVVGMGMGGLATKGLSVLPWLAKLGTKGRTIAAAAGYGAGEGAIAGTMAGKDIADEIRQADFAQLAEMEPFQVAYHSITDENMSHADKLEMAREKIAAAAWAEVTGKVAAVTGILSSPTGIVFDRMARGIGFSFGAKSRPKLTDIPKYAAGEFAQEMPQEGSESYLGDSAIKKYIDPTVNPWENVPESAVAGGVAGGVTGGIMGTGAHGVGRSEFNRVQRRLAALDDELFDEQGKIKDGADSAKVVEYLDLAGAAREQWGDEGGVKGNDAAAAPDVQAENQQKTGVDMSARQQAPKGPLERAVTVPEVVAGSPDEAPPVIDQNPEPAPLRSAPPLDDADVPQHQPKLGQVFPGEKVPSPVQQPKVDIYKATSTVGTPQGTTTQQEQTNDLSEMSDAGIETEETLQGLRSPGSGVSNGGNAGDKKEGSKGASRTVKASTVPNLEQYDGPNAQQEEPILAQLRGQGNQGSPEAGRVQGVSGGSRGAPESSASTGQDQQRRELRARESSVGNEKKAGSQYAEESPFGGEGGGQTVGGVGRNSRLGSEYNPLSAIDGDVSRGGDIYSGKGELEAATKTDESKDLTSKEVFSQQKKVQQDNEQKGPVRIKVHHPFGVPPYGGGIIEITGKPVVVEGAPAEVSFVGYRQEDGVWRVVERSTGLSIGDSTGKSLKEAIANASKAASAVDPDAWGKALAGVEKINEPETVAGAEKDNTKAERFQADALTDVVAVPLNDGATAYVRQADLDNAEKKRLALYTKGGKRKEGELLHRDNIDWDGSQRTKRNAEVMENPLFDVVTTTSGQAFKTQARAMSSDNPLVLEKAGVENDINRLEALYRAHMDDQSRLARSKASAEKNIVYYKKMISKLEAAQKIKQDTSGKNFVMEFNKVRHDERAKAGEGVLAFLKDVAKKRKVIAASVLGKLGGFDVVVDATVIAGKPNIQLSIDGAGQVLGQLTFSETGLMEADEVGLIMRLENMLREIDKGIDNNKKYILRDERTIERPTTGLAASLSMRML